LRARRGEVRFATRVVRWRPCPRAATGILPGFPLLPATLASIPALLAPALALAQSSGVLEPLPLARLDFVLEFDGVVDEGGWELIDPLAMTMYSPVFDGPLTEETEIRLAYDDEYLYVAGRLHDSDPAGIEINTLYRDLYSGDDILAVVIDSYNDYETAVWFVSSPAGVRNDRTVANDAEFTQGMPMNSDWNAHWDVRTSIGDHGWHAEFRIPFSTLGFQVEDDVVTMGVIAYRFIPRKNERHTFPAIEPRWGGLGFAKPSRARRVTLEGVKQGKPVYLTPFALGGAGYLPALPDGADAWESDRDLTRELGMDLRWSPTSNLTVDLTVNTDFAQVEADDQQVNLTRFPLFFPEKRQFFQERASTFQFSTGGFTDRLFHSRRIGLEGGEIVRIFGGARAVGRLGGMDFGFLDMQLAGSDGESGENLGVLRLNQRIFNDYSSVGGMITSRLGNSGRDNVAVALDLSVRPFGDEYVSAKWARTFDEAIEEADGLATALFLARWERRRDDGFSYVFEGRRVGADFRPGLGFQSRRDFFSYGGELRYRHLMPDESSLQSVGFNLTGERFHLIEGRELESATLAPVFNLEFRTGHNLDFTATRSFEMLGDPFVIAGVEVPEGEYGFTEGKADLRFPRAKRFRGNYSVTAGTFYDGARIGVSGNPTFTFSRHFELGGGYEVNRVSFPERSTGVTTQVWRLKTQFAYDARLSLTLFGQYSNVAELTSVNARLRYHFSEGTDLWLVWNEGLNMERANGLDPRLPLSAGRSFMIKYTRALVF